MMAVGLALLSLFFSPTVSAEVNGKYKYVSASGSIRVAGESIKISGNDMKDIMANSSGFTVIKNGKIRIDAQEFEQLLQEPGVKLKISVTGPKSLKLRKAGNGYVGTGSKPVILTVKGKIEGQAISGKFKFNFKSKVQGDQLTFNVPVTGSMMGYPIRGQIRIVCKR